MELLQGGMIALFLATFVALVKLQQVPERVFAGSVLTCLAFSFVSVDEILKNATNQGVITLLILVICSFAIERTSVLRRLSQFLINGSKFNSFIRTFSVTAFASAMMNNTAVVASLMTALKGNRLINPGKLFLPISYIAILGGTLTLIGTSTNLIVNSMWLEAGQASFHFFEFFKVGIVALVVCGGVVLITARFLPDMGKAKSEQSDYFLEARVEPGSSLIGKTIEDNGLRNLDSLFLIEVIKNNRLISPVSPHYQIAENDILIFTGDVTKVLTLSQFDGLSSFADDEDLLRENLTEVLIKPDSAVIGKSLKSSGFRARFDAAVVAVRREGSPLSGKLGEIVLRSGDLLVLATGQDFSSRTNLSKNFYIISGMTPDNMLSGWRDKLTILGFFSAIGASLFTPILLLESLMFYLALLVFTGCLGTNEIKRRFPIELFTIVVSALTLATALENTGVAALLTSSVESLVQGQSIYVAFVAIYLVTLITTELVTNNAAAALVFPLAYNFALGMGVDPMPFVAAVVFGASASFISPYSYQTNVMVFNAANYSLKDFVRFGIPVSIVYSLVVLTMIPKVFPF